VGMWIRDSLDVGFSDARERDHFRSYVSDGQALWRDPSLEPLARQFTGSLFTCTRSDLLAERDWYRSPHVQEVRRPGDADGFVYSGLAAPDGVCYFMSFHRPWKARSFSEKERELVNAFHAESAWIHAPSPAELVARLPPRLRDTLEGLLRGQSEK